MKIIKSDLKHGLFVLKTEVEEDLWHLKHLVEAGDKVKSRTMRSEFIERSGKKIKVGKKPMVLKIDIEKVEFKEHAYKLRLLGKIIEGPEDVALGSYHTIEIDVGNVLTIVKEKWEKYHLEKLRKAQKRIPKILLSVVDNNEATFGVLDGTGVNIVSSLRNPYSVQHEEEKTPEFYKSVTKEIVNLSEDSKKIILAGPGFAKEHVQKIIKEDHPEVNKKIITDSTSSATRSGINELLKRGNLEKIIQENEALRETKLVNEFFSHLKKEDHLAVYGLEELKKADEMGAVQTVLVSDKKIRNQEIEKLLNSIENKGGKIEIISTSHETGEQFERMGGLGAILRFKLY
jgi:protein pelota